MINMFFGVEQTKRKEKTWNTRILINMEMQLW